MWGYTNDPHHFPNSPTNQISSPTIITPPPLNGVKILEMSGRDSYVLMRAAGNAIYGFGYNVNGQLGNGANAPFSDVVKTVTTGVLAGKTLIQVYCHSSTSFAVSSDGKAFSWGFGGGMFVT